MIQSLQWPDGYSKTPIRKQFRFGRSLAESRDNLIEQICKLGGTLVVISSNAERRNDGLPYSKRLEGRFLLVNPKYTAF
jgi:hypothetical protein